MSLLEFADWAQIVDSTDVAAKGHAVQAKALEGKFKALVALTRPLLPEIGRTLLNWASQETRSRVYKHYFDHLLRLKAYRRKEKVEEILSIMSKPFDSMCEVATQLVDTDFAFRDTVDRQGNLHPVYQANIDIALRVPKNNGISRPLA